MSAAAAPVPVHRYRCDTCGNLTRFTVTTTRRTSAFHHFTVGGELTVEDEEVLEERIEAVTCRWCGSGGSVVELPPA
jgi:hypothetical protein